MVSADTNVLLRWALNDLPDQAAMAHSLLEGSENVRIEDGALLETVFVLEKVYGLDRALVAGYIRAVMSLGQVNCERSLFAGLLDTYEAHPRLSIMDCYLAAKAEEGGAKPLYTFDRHLAKKLEAATLLAASP